MHSKFKAKWNEQTKINTYTHRNNQNGQGKNNAFEIEIKITILSCKINIFCVSEKNALEK